MSCHFPELSDCHLSRSAICLIYFCIGEEVLYFQASEVKKEVGESSYAVWEALQLVMHQDPFFI